MWKGKISGDRVLLEESADEFRYYGRVRNGKRILSLEEAAYLIERGKITISEMKFEDFVSEAVRISPKFELRYIVYRDLKERGYQVQPSVTDFRVYPRGIKPGEGPSRYLVHVISEREQISLSNLLKYIETAENLKKEFVLAVVDEESDVTFYEVRRTDIKGEVSYGRGEGDVLFLEDRVVLWNPDLSMKLYEDGFFGRITPEKRLRLSLVESAYLIKKGIIRVRDLSGKFLDFQEFFHRAKEIEGDFAEKYAVYEDLREKGNVVKTGFKFGSHFRVYENLGGLHSKYLVRVVRDDYSFSLPELSAAIRLSHSVRKRMIFAHGKEKIDYIYIGRMKL
ncbi:MAG: tRNA-intron lyase [Candidatus Syntropharchaeia archaeon]